MSLDLIMGDTIFESGIGIDLPVNDGLLSFGLGGDLFGVNLVDGGEQPTIVGNPTRIDAYSTLLGPNGYLDLNIKETEAFTYFSVNKLFVSGSGGNSQFIGTFQSFASDGTTTVVGSGIVMEQDGKRDVIASMINGSTHASYSNNAYITDVSDLPTTEAAAEWRCLVAMFDPTGVYNPSNLRYKYVWDKTKNKAQSGGTTSTTDIRDLRGTSTIRVGNTGPRITQNRSFPYMGHAVFNRALTAAEMTLMYNRFRDIGEIQGMSL